MAASLHNAVMSAPVNLQQQQQQQQQQQRQTPQVAWWWWQKRSIASISLHSGCPLPAVLRGAEQLAHVRCPASI
jgi:hypothetical protein